MKKMVCCLPLCLYVSSALGQIFYLPEWTFERQDFETLFFENRVSSAPYISGDTFRAFCDHVLDEVTGCIDIDAIKLGDTVFVKQDTVEYFFTEIFQHIKNPFVMVSHNGDKDMPGNFAPYLDDAKIIAWFTVNLDRKHPKAFGLPIGIANRYWPHGNIDALKEQSVLPTARARLLCASYARPTHNSRQLVYDHFRSTSFCSFGGEKPYGEYLADLRKSKFVLSPRGAGMDCHRTWEAMLMGAIPIVPMTLVDPVYDDLPVLVIDGCSWEMLTEDFLEKKWIEFSKKTFKLEKLYANYWFNLIREQAQHAKGKK